VVIFTVAQDIWSTDKLILFLVFFIPGFISVRVYDLIVPGGRRDFSKELFVVVAYSAINYALLSPLSVLVGGTISPLSWLVVITNPENLHIKGELYYALLLLVVLICPALWPGIFYKLSKWNPISKHIVSPILRPWDYLFSGQATGSRSFWVIVHLNDEEHKKIGGRFGRRSYASSYPHEEQIYLERIYPLTEDGEFEDDPIPSSEGMIIFGRDILAVEFFKGEPKEEKPKPKGWHPFWKRTASTTTESREKKEE